MSAYYATFNDTRQARATVDELLRNGIGPDDISLVGPPDDTVGSTLGAIGGRGEAPLRGELESRGKIYEEGSTVGDASALVGRDDDPSDRGEFDRDPKFSDFTYEAVEPSTAGIDTSNRDTDVESVDQASDSQSAFEDMTFPPENISHSEHEHDDINLALLTGFPTIVPIQDDLKDTESLEELQHTEAFETIVVPDFGVVGGRGALATAALDFANPGQSDRSADPLIAFLRDRGVPDEAAQAYADAFRGGQALVAVEITPGETDEEGVERIFERSGAEQGALYDAPRFYEGGKGYAG